MAVVVEVRYKRVELLSGVFCRLGDGPTSGELVEKTGPCAMDVGSEDCETAAVCPEDMWTEPMRWTPVGSGSLLAFVGPFAPVDDLDGGSIPSFSR